MGVAFTDSGIVMLVGAPGRTNPAAGVGGSIVSVPL